MVHILAPELLYSSELFKLVRNFWGEIPASEFRHILVVFISCASLKKTFWAHFKLFGKHLQNWFYLVMRSGKIAFWNGIRGGSIFSVFFSPPQVTFKILKIDLAKLRLYRALIFIWWRHMISKNNFVNFCLTKLICRL